MESKKFEVTIKEEDVKEQLVNTLIKDEVSKLLGKILNQSFQSYATRNAMEEAVGQYVGSVVRELVGGKYKHIIKAKLEELMTEKVVEDVFKTVANRFISRLTES